MASGGVVQRKRDASQAVQDCGVLCRLDHVAHRQSLGSSLLLHVAGRGAWLVLFQAYSSKNNSRKFAVMLEVFCVSVEHEVRGEHCCDDGTERKINP